MLGVAAWVRPAPESPREPLGLFTSLPILWAEAPDTKALLQQDAPPHWARGTLEKRYRLIPMDTLDRPGGFRLLLMAQPRALMPQENVALDAWVQAGGRVLLFADPMLTWDSAFPIGDRRRPQDVALLSPILGRWGLDLRFDDAQPGGLRESAGLPVNLAGQLVPRAGGIGKCRIEQLGLVARCIVGKGRVTVVADAALLEPRENPGIGAATLESLLARAFAD